MRRIVPFNLCIVRPHRRATEQRGCPIFAFAVVLGPMLNTGSWGTVTLNTITCPLAFPSGPLDLCVGVTPLDLCPRPQALARPDYYRFI